MRFPFVVLAGLLLPILSGPPVAQDQSVDSSHSRTNSETIDVLAVARELATTTYAGFTYGSNLSGRQIDCTQFMQAVIERVVGRNLTDDEAKAVLISGLPSGARKLDSLVAAEDDRIKGVQYALTQVLPIGKAVSPDSARPGDLVQYWIKGSSGHYKGHTAIIEDVSRESGSPVARLFGSHKTLGRIGTAVDRHRNELRLRLKGTDRKVYIVRIEPELLAEIGVRLPGTQEAKE
jgi:hypothetical protein